jgi:hypothetical protein
MTYKEMLEDCDDDTWYEEQTRLLQEASDAEETVIEKPQESPLK